VPKYVVLFEHPDHPERRRFLSAERRNSTDWLTDWIYDAERFDTPEEARKYGLQLASVSLDDLENPLWLAKFRMLHHQTLPFGQYGSYVFAAAIIRDYEMNVCEMYDREPPGPNVDPECHEPTWDVVRPAVTTDFMTYQGVSTV
jgi:hypothetical protein